MGSSTRTQGGSVRKVAQFVKHPNYNSETVDMDVALIKLDVILILSDTVNLLPLNSNLVLNNGDQVYVRGWGLTTHEGSGSDELRVIRISKIGLSECKNRFNYSLITDNMFCAYEHGKASCNGDSGGPVVYSGTLVGIVSWGMVCGIDPGVYTNLSSPQVYNFVNRQIRNLVG